MHPPTAQGLKLFLAAAIADSSRHGKCCCSSCCGGGGGGDHFGSANVQSKGVHQVWNFSFSFLMYGQKGCIKGQSFAKKMGVSRGKLFLKNECIISHNPMPKLTPQLSERIPFLFLFGASVSEKKAAWNYTCTPSWYVFVKRWRRRMPANSFFDTSSSSSFASVRNSSLSPAETVWKARKCVSPFISSVEYGKVSLGAYERKYIRACTARTFHARKSSSKQSFFEVSLLWTVEWK